MTAQTKQSLPPVLDEVHVGTALYHPETGSLLDVNERLESMYGYTRESLRELSVEDYSANTYSHSEQAMHEHIRRAAEGTPQSFRWRIKREDGELIWVQIDLSATTLGGSRYVLGEVRDVSEYVAADRRVNLLSRIIRHNLRNDVTVINGYAEAIQTVTENERVENYAETIRNKSMGVGGLSTSVKEIEQATARSGADGSVEPARDVVSAVTEELGSTYPDAQIAVRERTRMWTVDVDALRHALRHAMENAIVHNGDPQPSVRVTIDESPNTGRVEIRIADDGPAIPENELRALDGASESTATSHGSGVGLFVMKWCVESLGGELKFERNDPRGNVVHIYLPPKEPPH